MSNAYLQIHVSVYQSLEDKIMKETVQVLSCVILMV